MRTSTAVRSPTAFRPTVRRGCLDRVVELTPVPSAEREASVQQREPLSADTVFSIVTANRVRDGIAIYMTEGGSWSECIADAARLKDADELLGEAKADSLTAISPYAIDARIVDGRVRPVSLREEIRAFGPTV